MGKHRNLTSLVSVVMLITFLLSLVSALSVLQGKTSANGAATQTSTVTVNPQISTLPVGGVLTITVNVTNVTDLYFWEVVLEYNATVLNLTDISIPDNNIFANYTQHSPGQAGGQDSVTGLEWVGYGLTLTGTDTVNASAGVLLSITFTALIAGASPLQLATKANQAPNYWYTFLDNMNSTEMPFIAQNGGATVGGPATYLTLTSTTGGTTQPPPNTYIELNNSQTSITALPNLGYDFVNWQLDGTNASSTNPIGITMDTNHTLQAVFTPHIPVTWTVNWQGGANFTTIQDAMNSPLVEYGDIVLVEPGVYTENVYMTKGLTLMGTDPDNTIIDGNGTGTVVTVYGNLTGFTIRNGQYGAAVETVIGYPNPHSGNGAYFKDSACISGNRIVNNLVGGVVVGSLLLYDIPHDTNCTVSNNYVANNTVFGIHIWDAWNNFITNNTVENNEYGIDFYGDSGNNTLTNNNMTHNTYNFGVIPRGQTTYAENQGGTITSYFNNTVDTSNTVNGSPVYYWINKNDTQVPTDAGYVFLCNCRNISVNGLTLSSNIEGILAITSNNTQISGNTITNNAYGIITIQCENNTLTENSLLDNAYGIYLGPLSKHTTMRNNSIGGSQFNFGMDPNFWLDTSPNGPSTVDESCLANDIDSSNTLDGKPIVYWTNQHDTQVPADAGFVMLINCTNITVQNLNLENNLENIVVFASNNTFISDNNLANSVYALRASDIGLYANSTAEDVQCFNLTVSDNTVTNSGVALELLQAENSTIQGNTLTGDPLGILSDTNYSTISANTITNCTYPEQHYPGLLNMYDLYVFYYPTSPALNFAFEWTRELMQLELGGIWVGGNYNTIYGNTVTNSTYSIVIGDLIRGIQGTGNTIFHNNFITSSTPPMQARDYGSGNQWDDGYPLGGNYWSDNNKTDIYAGPYQNITGSDGICDTPYQIPGPRDAIYYDRYPLTIPVNVYEATVSNGTEYDVDVQSNSTISNFTFNGPSQPSISFTVNGSSGTTGYCKVTIPTQVLWATGGQWTVLVNGTQTPYNVTEIAGLTFLSFSYTHSTENVQIIGTNAIPEYPPSMILAVLMILALAAVLLTIRIKRKK
jgi:parallel beta-helix repeat protein